METSRPPQRPPPAPDWAPLPGPADRVTFFDEQRRRRRQTWRFTALSAVAAAIAGVPLSMFVTPFVYLATVGALKLADRGVTVPSAVWSSLRDLARFVPSFLDTLFAPDAARDNGFLDAVRRAVATVDFPFGSPLLTLAALLLPGMVAVLLVWLGYRSLFRAAGTGGALLALGAREPRADDPEERQLVNVVAEMAIASGLPAPRVRLLDSPVPNAAAVGASVDDAVLVVSRELLDRMDRDETQGMIAHLVGAVGNGDLRIALSLTTVFQAVELVFTAFDALFNLSRSAWRDLLRVARVSLRGRADPRAAQAVSALLDHRLGEMREDGLTGVAGDAQRDRPQTLAGTVLKRLPFLYVVFLPLLLLYVGLMFLRLQVLLVRVGVIGPMLMLVWRTRRYLADATAVQLTRNPDGLARALTRLAGEGAVVPGGQWFTHLFVVGSEAAKGSKGSWESELGGVASHPPIKKRLARLRAQGARMRAETKGKRGPVTLGGVIAGVAGAVVLVPLFALMVYLMACVMAAVFAFAIISAVLFMGMAMAGIHALLT